MSETTKPPSFFSAMFSAFIARVGLDAAYTGDVWIEALHFVDCSVTVPPLEGDENTLIARVKTKSGVLTTLIGSDTPGTFSWAGAFRFVADVSGPDGVSLMLDSHVASMVSVESAEGDDEYVLSFCLPINGPKPLSIELTSPPAEDEPSWAFNSSLTSLVSTMY